MRILASRMLGLAIAWLAFGAQAAPADESWLLEVRETAGIERFGYPVCGEFEAPLDVDGSFELQTTAGTVPAQFTCLDASADRTARWSVDFALDLGPLETRRLQIVRAKQSDATNQARRLTVQEAETATTVRHPSLSFVVPNDLHDLFQQIDVAGDDFLVAGAPGLIVQLQDGAEVPLVLPSIDGKPPAPRVLKRGPLAVTLQYEGRVALPEHEPLGTQVTLDFPLGKSWVCVDWSVDATAPIVSGLGADVRLRLVPDKQHPVLADVGANGWTYAVLKPRETLAYLAEPPGVTSKNVWSVDRIIDNVAKPYALPADLGESPQPQGWAHLLDATRCTAIAVDEFATHARDSIRLSADGLVQLRRTFVQDAAPEAAKPVKRRLKFWLHVVRSPAQIGAATSPQSMQAPPEVRIVSWQSAASTGE